MRFQLLGPLRVSAALGDEVRIGRRKLRLLLALLLTRANTLVSVDSLIDDMWGADPPASARANLCTYVWALRRLLAPEDLAAAPISTDPRGYVIEVPPECLDVLTFERLVSDGAEARRRGDLETVARRLEEALRLWRGAAFENVPRTTGTLVATARCLEEQRLAAVEELFDARLALDRHAEVVAELQGWVVQYPLRERLWEQLMVALYRDGRQAEALAAYQRLRTHLIEEIGVEPSLPLRTLQSQILRSDAALAPPGGVATTSRVSVAPTPRQLPQGVATLVGRADALSTLDRLRADAPGPLVVIHGPPGVGKSTLAIHAADRWSDRFPDGHLYVDLRDATPGREPLCPGEGLGRFLRALGVPGEEVPRDIAEAAALFRTLVSTRRMVLVLDNAATAGQVRPLLPGGSGSAVLVTSRSGLTSLEGVTHLRLGPLDPGAARAMLECLVGTARAGADAPAVARLAELCDHLPLALRVAAARLKARPDWTVRHLVDRLADERLRLTELAAGDLAVRGSLEVSYAALERGADPSDRAAARALRLIGLLPAGDLDTGMVAALLDTSLVEADRIVERLLDVHLIEAVGFDRYRMSDLVRLFARELATTTCPSDEAIAAVTRVLNYRADAVYATGEGAYIRTGDSGT